MVFNNNFNGKSLDQAHAQSVFFDPYIGMDAGYLQVAHLHGKGKVLIAVPSGKTPFEAWRPLTDDPLPSGSPTKACMKGWSTANHMQKLMERC
jgi:hypothetical protein